MVDDEYLTGAEICSQRKFSKVTLYALIKRGVLPKGELVGLKAVRWRRSVVEAAFAKLNEGRRNA